MRIAILVMIAGFDANCVLKNMCWFTLLPLGEKPNNV